MKKLLIILFVSAASMIMAACGDGGVIVTRDVNIADTGQTLCASGTEGTEAMGDCAAATVTGQDGSYADVPAARNFVGPTAHSTYTSDYTTEDTVAGLTWMTCTQGQVYDESLSSCTGLVSGLDWEDGIASCDGLNSLNGGSGYAGINSWRLPTIHELITLVDRGEVDPAIDGDYFPDTTSSWYWTSDTHRNEGNAFAINFDSGNVLWWTKMFPILVRCVSSTTPATVTTSSLTWTRCSLKTVSSTPEMDATPGCTDTHGKGTWQDALAACENLEFADITDWRLPNVTELHSLVDVTNPSGIFINTNDFPDLTLPLYETPYFWTSTTYNGIPGPSDGYCQTITDCAWYVNFLDGYVEGVKRRSQKNQANFVRCVSGPSM